MTAAAPPRLGDYLQHIVQAIDRIERYTAGLDAAGFATDTKTQDAVVLQHRCGHRDANRRRSRSSARREPSGCIRGVRNRTASTEAIFCLNATEAAGGLASSSWL